MKSISMSLDLFRDFDPRCLAADEFMLNLLLEALTIRNVQWLVLHPETPLLYPAEVYRGLGFEPNLPSSGVYYQPEPEGEENFDAIPKVHRLGSGDCDDLACWRAAELRVRFSDPAAKAIFAGEQTAPNYIQYHVMARRGDGGIEDPSAILGMGDTPELLRAEMGVEAA